MKFWNFTNKSSDVGELQLYGEISSASWFGDEVTPKQFKQDLDGLGDIKDLNIYINSGGGDVFAGQAIHSMLKRHTANKTVYIDGLAASIASVIAMAGDEIVMPSNAMMMIHKASTVGFGNSDDFRKMADNLEKIEESIQAAYEEKTGKDRKEIKELMDKETWMTAQDAVDMGFADRIEAEKKLAASAEGAFFMLNGQQFDMSIYKNAPVIDLNIEIKDVTAEGAEWRSVEIVPATESVNIKISPTPADSGDESRPVLDNQHSMFNNIRRKILKAFKED